MVLKVFTRLGMPARTLLRRQYGFAAKEPILLFSSLVCVHAMNEQSPVAEGRSAVVVRSVSI
jgi:hypothetical protein